MRRPALAAAVAALALAAGGCGGSKVTVEQVPGGPVTLSVPRDSSLDATATATPSATPTATAGATAPSTQSGSAPASQGTSTTADSGGGATPPATQDGPTNDTAPPTGSDAQKFEDFCAQNPGAC
jgi:hypothetical protein